MSWLPLFHDMGLIFPVLNTLYVGGRATLFSPQHFVQKPERWLTAISRYRAHTSASPNFGYELSLLNATPQLIDSLDLAHWRVAVNAAEPVRATTLRRFAEMFGPAGFRPEAFSPGYGLAEATLMVSGGRPGDLPLTRTRPDGATTSPEVVSCGVPHDGVTVVIADPDRHTECAQGQVGEIWVAGNSVARGYWHNEQATRELPENALDHADRIDCRVLLISGSKNGLWLDSNKLCYDVLAARQPQLDVRYVEIPAYGHLDAFIGRNAALDVFGYILDFLHPSSSKARTDTFDRRHAAGA